jgi:glycosyltransferase involved in cell wall biosynthesis
VLAQAFPPDLPNVRHVSINSPAAAELLRHRDLPSAVIPNVFDFDRPPNGDTAARAQLLREELRLRPDDLLFVQPTRVIPRKGIELAIELIARLGWPGTVLLITSPAGDEGFEYLDRLVQQARRLDVDLRYGADRFRPGNGPEDDRDHPAHSLVDAYVAADVITYPSLYEGFGNALVEAVYFGRLLVVNRYPVYEADIRPLGFRFVELDGVVTDQAVEELRRLLHDPVARATNARHNYALGHAHLSYERLARDLARLLEPHVDRASSTS